jgi:hypothetical protein
MQKRLVVFLFLVLCFASAPATSVFAANTIGLNSSELGSASSAEFPQRRRYRRYRRYGGPVRAARAPIGASARCRDGTYSLRYVKTALLKIENSMQARECRGEPCILHK